MPVTACLAVCGLESCLGNGLGVWLFDYLQRWAGLKDADGAAEQWRGQCEQSRELLVKSSLSRTDDTADS